MKREVTLTALGDVAVVGNFRNRFLEAPLAEVIDPALLALLASSDVCMANVECVLTDSRDFEVPGYGLWAPPEVARVFREMGVTIATLANNHIRDVGDAGVLDTLWHLRSHHVVPTGAGRNRDEAEQPLVVEQNGLRIGILAVAEQEYNGAGEDRAGSAAFEPERWALAIAALGKRVDVVVVSVHAGHEFAPVPSPRIRAAYRQAVDAGAHCVIGHHPHVVQGVESYRGAPIFYSLGNFCFDSDYVAAYPGWDIGIVPRLRLTAGAVEVTGLFPIRIDQGTKVSLPAGSEREAAMEKVEERSRLLGNESRWKAAWEAHVQWRFERDYLPNFTEAAAKLCGNEPEGFARRLYNLYQCPTHRELVTDYLRSRAGLPGAGS